jgi:transcriptional regulator with PAS, ATPase and Fis domain
MLRIRELARRAGCSDAKTLITGESGVGKDVVAREIHAKSARASREFVAVNCAGIAEELLESELFGHVKGSFTGAYRDCAGKLQLADGGTLFLDEIGEMSPRMQAALLRFLESGEIQPVGDTRSRTVNVRVIAATNRNLPERVAAGHFREDLLYRLRVIEIAVPPLRERRADIPALVEHVLRRVGNGVRVPTRRSTPCVATGGREMSVSFRTWSSRPCGWLSTIALNWSTCLRLFERAS